MSLPQTWIEALFSRLAVRYGTAWSQMWTGLELDAVAADWAQVLDGVNGASIAHALNCLPLDRPPTATKFRELCRSAPDTSYKPPQLDAPKADPDRVHAELAKMKAVQSARPKEWAHRLMEREGQQNGKRGATSHNGVLSMAQRSMWRSALGYAEGLSIETIVGQQSSKAAIYES